MKKVVLKVELYDEKTKQKAMKAVSGLEGLESIEINMKDKKMTVTGDIDPVMVVAKLRKYCYTHILTVGPAKEEKKNEEPKKPDDNKSVDVPIPMTLYPMPYYPTYQALPMNNYYYRPVVEECPNGCVIC